ncbi:hypothetical protein CERZMDRAFT_34504 [Cercospora zeae-maydis SCOH1-5]|uniref:UBC core domain-containing protein n=1 Tax=Cercospora zeae-maydis SCOH1-5 TaxID=717836 RepID=A0A6A6FRA1_9PEZI|nr:hypothetical protein CERZMDRAFT_34504 [Cercospora zeae-maydis SCOH1-5]
MPRRQFIADLKKVQNGPLPPGISTLCAGEDDGQIEFSFVGAPIPLVDGPVTVTAMVTDLGDYPTSHEYYLFGGEDAPRDISKALGSIRGINKKTVFEMLDIVASTLRRVQPDQDGDSQMLEDDDGFGEEEEDDGDDDDAAIYDSDHEIFDVDTPAHNPAFATKTVRTAPNRAFRQRIREDLRATKAAGFKVGHLGHLLAGNSSYVAVAIRIVKLGISEEAMQAWKIEPNEYLTLLIQYPNGYKTNEELQGFEALRLASNLAIRVVVGKRPKPTLQEVIKAFTSVRKSERGSIGSTTALPSAEETADENSSIRDTFISKPLNALLQERFVPILRSRSMGLDWNGAERWYDEMQAVAGPQSNADVVPDRLYVPEEVNKALPEIVRADHYQTAGVVQYSFPLLAMQFALRHFVRCADFCLVCHRKLESDVEAIKPYVCSKDLCLYQYMAIGLGPSIEHEVIAQPYVVDLLISFCYSSAANRKLKDFPDGLSLTVPPVGANDYNPLGTEYLPGRYGRPSAISSKAKHDSSSSPAFEAGFDHTTRELIFFNRPGTCPVRRGDWILLNSASMEGQDLHCRVSDTTFFPTITVDPPIVLAQQRTGSLAQDRGPQTPAVTPQPTRTGSPAQANEKWVNATFQVYAQDFSSLETSDKCLAICRLLDTLPPVTEMREYLIKRQPADLQSWSECISSSALSLLRWIIASNRSCIMQVDGNDPAGGDNAESSAGAPTVFGKTQERCYGMKDYMQFRFAMGAPDKEQRFITEVRNTATRLNLKHQSIFAWHGSPLYNWHGIIREGLHYKNADHGRAYGDGVYHAKDASTSTSYSGMSHTGVGGSGARGSWPSSVLKISSALALNEIVNAPAEFQSQHPHYVVKQLDWIQTRYLFVRVAPENDTVKIGPEVIPSNPHPQDPSRTPTGVDRNLAIVIPASAIKSGKRPASASPPGTPSTAKKLKTIAQNHSGNAADPIVVDDDDDAQSIVTDVDDRELLESEPEEPEESPAPCLNGHSFAKKVVSPPKTDFVPGSLDFDTLPIMPLPTYATPAATKRLMQELQSLQKVQDSTPLVDLGWYIDVDKIENAYQWIVELHSFHTMEINGKKLPLSDDMKNSGIKSIVLEIRFNKDFPFSPPYVRVIRPHFKTFAQGGGGHIVMGGAMCMEMLTNTGWSSVLSMESVLMSIRMNIASEPFARLEAAANRDYGAVEGAEGYIRACHTHGWEVPRGFREMAYSGTKQ